MQNQIKNEIKKWIKNEFLPISLGLSLMIISLVFIYYLIEGTIIIILGGHHLFASTIWNIMIIATIYLLSLLITQLWKNKKTSSYEKIKPTIIYIFLIIFISYLTIANKNFTLLTMIYTFAIIGAITGYLLTKQNETKFWKEKNMQQKRKTEAIELLNFLIEQYKKNPDLEDIRLGQLLLNVVPNESLLYHLESKDIQTRIDNFLKKV